MSKTLPEVYYGLHMVEGVAEYAEPGSQPYRILVGEDAIKNMNPTFQGKPVYVDHVDEVNVDHLRETADGYVMESFYNKSDGKNWVKFIVVTDKAKEAIRMGWKLSNAYVPKGFSGGGLWHGVEYSKEVTGGEYEHLAIVRHPRYEESTILTPEQFKEYNGEKEKELTRLANSKEKTMGFKLFERKKVENSATIENMMIELPKSKKEMLLTEVVTQFDAILNMNGYANGDHMVKVNDSEEMSVNDLVKKHMEMCNEMAEMKKAKEENSGEGEPGAEVENDEDEEGTKAAGAKDVGDRGGDKALENEEEEEPKEDKKKNAREKAAALKNAHLRVGDFEEQATVELSSDKVARGAKRYGSK